MPESRSIFEALARAIGLFLVVQPLPGLIAAIVPMDGFRRPLEFWAQVIVSIIIGLLLLLKGGDIANRVYRERRDAG